MPASSRTRSTRASRAAVRLPSENQSGIQRFTKAVKPGVRGSSNKGALSLKRKLGDIEESEVDRNSLSELKQPKLGNQEPSRASSSTEHYLPKPSPEKSSRPPTVALNADEETTHVTRDSSQPDHTQSTAFRDFVRLYASFISALSLHYTHNGSTAPANLADLFPTIERIWKKRKITVEDVQRLLYVQEHPGSVHKFRLCDYGTRYCIERIGTEPQTSQTRFKLPLDETGLSDRFSRNLNDLWRERLESSNAQDADFTQHIPLIPIHKSVAVSPPQNAARQRLLDLRTGTIRLKVVDTSQTKKDEAAAAREPNRLHNRQSGLLQRIQAKVAHQSKLPPAPSKETMARRSAADRIPEIVNVLLMLSPSASPSSPSKKPFRLHTITQNIQDSMRNPISKQEVEACLDMLSQPEVAGDWITVVTLNSLKSVVLRSGRNISQREIIQRVTDLKDECVG